jgi:aspartokinase
MGIKVAKFGGSSLADGLKKAAGGILGGLFK